MSRARVARRGRVVSAQATKEGTRSSLKMRAGDQSASQNQREIEKKLQRDEADADRSRAMLPEPPNTEEKQHAEQRLVTMEDRQRGTTIDGQNQHSGAE